MGNSCIESPVEKKFDRHEQEIFHFFGSDRIVGGVEKSKFRAFNPYILVFSNRSGSNALAEDMKISLEVGPASERVNSPAVINKSRDKGFDYFDQYLYWVFSSQKSTTPGVKASVDQLLFLYTSGVLRHCFGDPEIIFIERRDLLAQAISMFIARETGQWTSRQEQSREEPVFDRDKILTIQKNIAEGNARFNRLVSAVGLDVFRVIYEDYVEDRAAILSALAGRLGVTYKGEPDPSRKKIKKQVSKTKELYHQYIRDEFSQGIDRE